MLHPRLRLVSHSQLTAAGPVQYCQLR